MRKYLFQCSFTTTRVLDEQTHFSTLLSELRINQLQNRLWLYKIVFNYHSNLMGGYQRLYRREYNLIDLIYRHLPRWTIGSNVDLRMHKLVVIRKN